MGFSIGLVELVENGLRIAVPGIKGMVAPYSTAAMAGTHKASASKSVVSKAVILFFMSVPPLLQHQQRDSNGADD